MTSEPKPPVLLGRGWALRATCHGLQSPPERDTLRSPARGPRRPPVSGCCPLIQLLFPLTVLWFLDLRPLAVPLEPPNTTQAPAVRLPYLLHICARARARTPTHTHTIPSPLSQKRKLVETSQTKDLRPPRGFACVPNELSLLEYETVSEKILDPGPVPENHRPSPVSAVCQAKPWRGRGGDTTCWPLGWRRHGPGAGLFPFLHLSPFPSPAQAPQQGGAHTPHPALAPDACGSRLSPDLRAYELG